MTALDEWLNIATRELSPESAVQVRAEIEEHYRSALDGGATPEAAIAALGDPKAANQANKKVLLTEYESRMAPVYARGTRPSVRSMVSSTVFFVAIFAWLMTSTFKYGTRIAPLWIVMWSETPLRWILLPTTPERSRILVYAGYARDVIASAVAWWTFDLNAAVIIGVVLFLFRRVLDVPRTAVLQKLEAGQTYSLPSREHELTSFEASFLRTLRNGDPSRKYAVPFLFVMVGVLTAWLPQLFGAILFMLAIRFSVPYVVDVYTPERSRWFRVAKWTLMALAAVFPVLLGAKARWAPAAYIAFLFWLFDAKRISLRRKLPVEEWPKELYL